MGLISAVSQLSKKIGPFWNFLLRVHTISCLSICLYRPIAPVCKIRYTVHNKIITQCHQTNFWMSYTCRKSVGSWGQEFWVYFIDCLWNITLSSDIVMCRKCAEMPCFGKQNMQREREREREIHESDTHLSNTMISLKLNQHIMAAQLNINTYWDTISPYKNFNLLHAGNLLDRARFFTHFAHLHEILPYPLLVMCRKCEEMSHFGNRTCRKSQSWSSVKLCVINDHGIDQFG